MVKSKNKQRFVRNRAQAIIILFIVPELKKKCNSSTFRVKEFFGTKQKIFREELLGQDVLLDKFDNDQ